MDTNSQGQRSGGDGGTRQVALDQENAKPRGPQMLPVWFFVGVILLIYGVLILGTGILEISRPPLPALSTMPPVVRHPAIWWGALLTAIGGFYVGAYWPKKS